MSAKKKHPKIRKDMLLCTAIDMSLKIGYQHLTRDSIAKEAGVSSGLINKYFGTVDKLKKEVLRAAIEKEILEIMAQGLGIRDPEITKLSDEMKQKIAEFIVS